MHASGSRLHGQALPVGYRLDGFDILGTIGYGGFGNVYAAVELASRRTVAIKEYLPRQHVVRGGHGQLCPQTAAAGECFRIGLQHFLDDARVLADLRHPALLPVERVWQQNGTAYFSMPCYAGVTLQQLAEDPKRQLDATWLEPTLGRLLGALESLHRRGYQHRDISPDNIILDAKGLPVLLDFSGARQHRERTTGPGALPTKPGYSPLEQYVGEVHDYGAWSDLYALGAVMYCLIARRTPPSSLARSVQDTLVPLSSMGLAAYSARTLAAIDRVLSLHRQDRPQSVAEFAADLALKRRGDIYLPGTAGQRSAGSVGSSPLQLDIGHERHLWTLPAATLLAALALFCCLGLALDATKPHRSLVIKNRLADQAKALPVLQAAQELK